jgi:hypothetical protein
MNTFELLSASELECVSGGEGTGTPKGTWLTSEEEPTPKGTWLTSEEEPTPKGTW